MKGVLKEQRKHAGLQPETDNIKEAGEVLRVIKIFMVRTLRKVLAFSLMGRDGD